MSSKMRSIGYLLLVSTAAIFGAACTRSEAATSKTELPPPDPRGCLAAILVHEEHTDDRDGVSHDVRYKERYVRCADHTWTERVLPPGAPAQEAPAHEGHREMPPSHELARLVAKTPDGKAELTLVSRRDRQLIAISPESYDVTHFDSDWDGAAHLLPARVVSTMTKLSAREAPPGAEWREKKTANGSIRVLWSPAYDFPLEIESESSGGQKRDHLRVILDRLPADADLPWATTKDYTRKLDTDFMD
jgi:hypothetical protein